MKERIYRVLPWLLLSAFLWVVFTLADPAFLTVLTMNKRLP